MWCGGVRDHFEPLHRLGVCAEAAIFCAEIQCWVFGDTVRHQVAEFGMGVISEEHVVMREVRAANLGRKTVDAGGKGSCGLSRTRCNAR